MDAEKDSTFLRACARRPVSRVPVWFMRQAGRYLSGYRRLREKHSILQLAKTPELACEVTLEPVRLMPVDAAILFADILMILEPMGVGLRFVPGPVIDRPVRSPRDAAGLREEDPKESLACVMKTVRLLRRELGPTPLIGFAGAPFTVASYLIEGQSQQRFLRTKAFMQSEPRAWNALMGKIARLTAAYLLAQAEAGAQALQIFDSWIGALSPEDYRRHVLPHSRRLISALKPAKVPVIHFGTGTAGWLEDFSSAGGDVVGVDWRVDLEKAWKRVGPRAVQGNLDPALLLAPKAVLRRGVEDVLRRAGGRRGFIFNLGHGIFPETAPDSVKAVVEWVHEWKSR